MIVRFYNPLDVVSNIISPAKAAPAPTIQQAGGGADAEAAARAEASRKARAAALARSGRRSTLLTPGGGAGGQSGIQSQRRSLLGATG